MNLDVSGELPRSSPSAGSSPPATSHLELEIRVWLQRTLKGLGSASEWVGRFLAGPLPPLLLALAVTLLALTQVLAEHRIRMRFVELQTLRAEANALRENYGRLQLEQASRADPARIERLARERLAMKIPHSESLVIVWP